MATTTREHAVAETDLFELDTERSEEQKATIDTQPRFFDDGVTPGFVRRTAGSAWT